MRSCCVLALVVLAPLLSGPAQADAPHAPALKGGAPLSIAAYGRQNPHCAEWTDGCVVCAMTRDHAQCSTPGIACTPAGLTCTRKTAPQ